jgi:hypothetical protein
LRLSVIRRIERLEVQLKPLAPRLPQVDFDLLVESEHTKDILYVKEFLGHNKVETTLLYIQLAETIFKALTDEFTVRIVAKPEEIKALLEVGFEYICEKDHLLYFRKRK